MSGGVGAHVFVKTSVSTETVVWKISSIVQRYSSGQTVSAKTFTLLSAKCRAQLAFKKDAKRLDFACLTITLDKPSSAIVALVEAWVIAADGRSTNRHTSHPDGTARMRLIQHRTVFDMAAFLNVSKLAQRTPTGLVADDGSLTICIRMRKLDPSRPLFVMAKPNALNAAANAAEEYSFDNNGVENLVLARDKFTDVTLMSKEGVKFPAHRVLLAAHSPVLANLLKGLSGTDTRLELAGVNAATIEAVLNFLHEGQLVLPCSADPKAPTLPASLAFDVLTFATKYKMERLHQRCVDEMVNGLAVWNVVDAIFAAQRFKIDLLQKAALRYFADHLADVTRTEGWVRLVTDNYELAKQYVSPAIADPEKPPQDESPPVKRRKC